MAEDRIILGDVSWQFGHFSFVLRHFFLLGVGLELDMKWVGVAKFFGPTISVDFEGFMEILVNPIASVDFEGIV